MKANMGTLDKILRIGIAITVAILFYLQIITGTWAIILLSLSAIFVITSLVSFCPLYLPFGISTCTKPKKP